MKFRAYGNATVTTDIEAGSEEEAEKLASAIFDRASLFVEELQGVDDDGTSLFLAIEAPHAGVYVISEVSA